MPTDWQVALAVLGTLLTFSGVLLAVQKSINGHIDRRFAEAERARKDAEKLWRELITERDRRLDELSRRIDHGTGEHPAILERITALAARLEESRLEAVRSFVSREAWLEQTAAINFKLDKLRDLLGREGQPT